MQGAKGCYHPTHFRNPGAMVMKCVVTGAAGFIGSFLSERLLAAGHEVTVNFARSQSAADSSSGEG